MAGLNKLSAIKVERIDKVGRYGDGGGLWLQVSKVDKNVTKSWLFRYTRNGKARQMGLGSFNTFGLKEARERATKARQAVADGIDPIEARRSQRAAALAEEAKQITFAAAAEHYIKAHKSGWKNDKHADQWTATIETYANPTIGKLPVSLIETAHIIKVLKPIWQSKTETASRVRGRIEKILGWATVSGFRSGDNPARWKGHLSEILPARSKVAKVRHHAALAYADVPAFMARLRALDSISARALEFTVLTAARTGEAIGVRREEVDFKSKLWTVPAERMKADKEHRVPLTDRTVEILQTVPEIEGNPFFFPGARDRQPLSNMAMLGLLKGMDGTASLTVHGFRSAFRDWCSEQTNYLPELAEAALAHSLKDKTEAAYKRGDALAKRRKLMEAWAGYCARSGSGTVVPIRAKG
ncbi:MULTISPECIES: integrase arm-type DNA-binding domain-containing protein [unclassified Mesorhizobium]|uniref:tyrosine-type recombinase/integrase n=1 Tax=unclassified Mesorhizobium TaxID=325217 RepID=UPI00333AE567